MRELVRDLRHAARGLRRNPAFVLLTVATLGLGIGANTAVFTVIHGVLLEPLPYEDPERLVVIEQSRRDAPGGTGVSIKEYYEYRENAPAFESLVEYHQMSFDLLRRGEPDRVSTGVVSHDFFDVLGIEPLHGRTFRREDDVPGAARVLILSHPYWRERFGADPRIVNQVFEMNGQPHTVIGVLPDVPLYPEANDVYMPVLACPFRAAAEENIEQSPRTFGILSVFGRVKPGTTQEAAAANVASVCHRFTQADSQAYRPESGFSATARDVGEALTSNARPILLVLLGTTGLVLLLACANVANLTLARVLGRERELALRAALGAGRGRLLRLLLAESLGLSLAGGALGVVCAVATLGLLTSFTARFTERTQQIELDASVLAFAVVLSCLVGVASGLAPALLARVDLASALNHGMRGATGTTARRRTQGALVVAQVALSVVLLSGAGLLLVSVTRLQQVDPGYRVSHVLSAEAFGNFVRYPDAATLIRFYQAVLERLDAHPAVESAAVTNAVPLSSIQPFAVPLQIEGVTEDAAGAPTTDVRVVSEGYFDTLEIPLLRGRAFERTDTPETPLVAVVNRALTARWGRREVIGSRVSLDGGQTWATVVGVTGDVRMFSLEQESGAQVYVALRQTTFGLGGRFLVRSSLGPAAAGQLLREAIRAEDPDMPIENAKTVAELREASLATPRLTATLLALFAALALVIAVVGVTGVIAASVVHRTQEFGVRMALGAQRSQVLLMVLGQGLVLVGAGVAIGVVGALGLGRALGSFLYETRSADPLALGAAALLFVLAGALACLGPALRATSVDPLVALRE